MAKPVHTAVSFTSQIVQYAFTTGQIHAEGMALKSTLNASVCDFEPYVKFFIRHQQHKKDGVSLIGNAENINNFLSVESLLCELGSKLELCDDRVVYPLFAKIIQIQSENVESSLKLLEKACNNQQHPPVAQLDLVRKQIFQLRLIPTRCEMGLNQDQTGQLKKIDTLFEQVTSAFNLKAQKSGAAPISELSLRRISEEYSSGEDEFHEFPQSDDPNESDSSSTSSSLNSSWAQLEFPSQETLKAYSQERGSDPDITGQDSRAGIDHG